MSDREPQHGHSRRNFLKAALATAAASLLSGGNKLTNPAASDSIASAQDRFTPARLSPSPELLAAKPELEGKIHELETVLGPYQQRTEAIIETAEGSSTLQSEFRIMFPFKNLNFKDIFPAYKAHNDIQKVLSSIETTMEQVAEASPVNQEKLYSSLLRTIASNTTAFSLRTGAKAREVCSNLGVVILPKPSIQTTPEGQSVFEEDKRYFEDLLKKAPIQDNCTVITLNSKEYGSSAQPAGGGLADYSFTRNADNNVVIGSVEVNLSAQSPDHDRGIDFWHELGHKNFVFFENTYNLALVNLLEPTQIRDLTIEQLKIMNNSEYGLNLSTLPQMFSGFQHFPANFSEFMKQKDELTPDELRALTTRYPLRTLLEPFRSAQIQTDGKFVDAKWASMLDIIALETKDESKTTRFAALPKLSDSKKIYENFGEFAKDYTPLLEEGAQLGNVKAIILLAGFQAFGPYLNNYDHFIPNDDVKKTNFTPKNDMSATTWENYANFTLSTAFMIHLALNGEIGGKDYRNLLTENENKTLEQSTAIRIFRTMGEFFAENIGVRTILQDRLPKDDPYLNLMAKIKNTLAT